MTGLLRSRRRRLWHVSRFLFLLIGLGALAYTGWFYFGQYWHQYRTSQTFDKARADRITQSNPRSDVRTDAETPAIPQSKVSAPDSVPEFPARLTIARLHLATMIEEGVEERTLSHAAGHIPSTALPGHSGNVGVAGHRDTLFRSLRGIREHDRIVISTLSNDYDYEVTATAIVNPNDVAVLAPTPGENTLTLVTCYPFYYVGSAPNRFIVKARQVSPGLAEQKPQPEPTVTREAPAAPEARQEIARPETPRQEIARQAKSHAAPRVTRTTRGPTGVDHNPGLRKVRFEVLKSHSRELAPGISIGLTATDVSALRVDGWMWVMPDRRTIRLRNQRALEPVIFYRDGRRRELVITAISRNSVSGYLIVPADRR